MNLKKSTYLVLILSVFLLLPSCGTEGTSEPDAQALAFELLAGNWGFGTNGTIVLDGQDVSLNFAGFSLSFTDGSYQTTNAGDLLSASGTWSWVNENAQQLLLDTGEEVTIQNLTQTSFEFSFFHQGNTAAGIQGNYTITVNK